MKSTYESKYRMYLTVRDYLKLHSLVTAKLPGFDGYFEEFNQIIDDIKAIKEQLEHGGAGMSSHVEQQRKDLVKRTLAVSRKAEAYATLSNNVLMAKEVHYSETELNKAKGTSLSDKALTVYNRALEHAVALEKYGVTADMLTWLKASIDTFCSELPSVRMSIAGAKLNNDKLNERFKANDAGLKKIDLLLEVISSTNPDIYNGYKNTRKAVRLRGSSLALMVKVVCAASGVAIRGAKITLTLRPAAQAMAEDQTAKVMVKKTGEKGMLNVKGSGLYDIVAEKPGYIRKELTGVDTSSDTVKLNIKLEKN
jgi:hypothetical protein